MDDGRTHIVGAALAVLVVGGLALGAVAVVGLGADGAIEETAVANFTVTTPECDDPRRHNVSTRSVPYEGDRRLVINNTVPVNHLDTTLEADLRTVGPERYLLNVQRVAGDDPADCYAEARYNATLNVSDPERYTVVIAYDGRVRHVTSSDPGSSGVYGNVLPPAAEYRANRSDAVGGAGGSGDAGSAVASDGTG
jgi:hypothetical protein